MSEEKLMFPIGFDASGATSDFIAEWSKTIKPKIDNALAQKPIKVKLSVNTKQIENLADVQKRLKQLKLEPITPETKDAISSLVRELKTLERIMQNIQKYNTSTKITTQANQTEMQIQREANAQERLRQQTERLRLSKGRLATQEQRLIASKARSVSSINAENAAYKTQLSYLDRLLLRWSARALLLGSVRILDNIRETTAEFELQRVALGAIIQDADKADKLFNQIKAAAIESPFQIKDLVRYTKELSAYRIETDQLFETTQRLADISAGLGVDMSRLVLAYGQVRAASVLRGQELRLCLTMNKLAA